MLSILATASFIDQCSCLGLNLRNLRNLWMFFSRICLRLSFVANCRAACGIKHAE